MRVDSHRDDDGDDFGFIGKMVGDEDEITEAAPAGLLTKAVAPAPATVDISSFQMPEEMSSIRPSLYADAYIRQHGPIFRAARRV